jgi:N utilization substance protein A
VDKITDIIYSIAYEKNLEQEKVEAIIKDSMLIMAKETISDNFEYSVYFDNKSKNINLYKKIFAVEGEGDIEDGTISIKEAQKVDDNIVVGDFLESEIKLDKLTRSSSNFLYISIEKRLQSLLEEDLYQKYQKQIGQIISASVVRLDNDENTIVEVGEVKGILPLKNRIKGERFEVGDTFSSILNYVKVTKQGIYLELSRTTPKFLNELLHLEVPELKEGHLEIINSARIPGVRAKIAIRSYSPTIDPIGSIVGTKGVRIKAVSSALSGENIDVIEYSEQAELFITRALSPAIVINITVYEEDKKAIATLAYDQKRKAIGSNGFNIRLASMLTGYHIDLIEEKEANFDNIKTVNEKTTDTSNLEDLFSD